MASVFHHLLNFITILIVIIIANLKLMKMYKINGLKISLCVPSPPRKNHRKIWMEICKTKLH